MRDQKPSSMFKWLSIYRLPRFGEGREKSKRSGRLIALGFTGSLVAAGIGLYLAKDFMGRRRKAELDIYRMSVQKEREEKALQHQHGEAS